MGKGNKQTTNTSQQQTSNQASSNQGSSTTTLPQNIQNAADWNLNYGSNAAVGWNPTMQQAPAGFTDDQMQGMGMARGVAMGQVGNDAVSQAVQGAQGVMGYNPQQVSGQTYDPSQMSASGYNAATLGPAAGYQASLAGPVSAAATQGYTATTLDPNAAKGYNAVTGTANQQNRGDIQNVGVQSAAQQLPSYLQAFDPSYQSAVINSSMNDLDRARQLTQQSNAAQAAQAGAFGDSRQGVMDAETNDAYLRNVANLSSNLRQSGFNTALGALQGDTSNQLQSQLANQGADIGVSANNAGFQNQFGLANMGAQNQAGQYLAGTQNQFQTLNQAAQNQASQFQADAANQAAQQQAGLQASTNLANAASQNQAGQFNATNQNQFGLANQGALNQAGQFNSQLGFNVGANNQAAQNAGGQFNANNLQQAQALNQSAGLAGQNVNLAGAGALNQFGQTQQNMGYNNANALYNIGQQQQNYNQGVQNTNYANQQAVDNSGLQRTAYLQQVLQGTPYGTTTNTSASGNQAGSQQGTGTQVVNNQQGLGSTLLNAAGAGLGAYFSDERAKTDIKPMAEDSAAADPSAPWNNNADLQKIELGRSSPSDTAPAVGRDYSPVLGAALKSAMAAPQQPMGGGGISPLPGLPGFTLPAAPNSTLVKGTPFSGPGGGATYSDERLKTGFKPMISDPLKAIHKLKPITYRWKGTGQPDSGFSAQNVQEAIPSAAREMGFGLKGYSMPGVVGVLAEGLKALDHKVNRQKRGLLA